MPKTKEEKAATKKIWYEKNKEKINAEAKVKYQNNKEEVKARSKKWREDNPDKVKAYKQIPEYIKYNRIYNWKNQEIRVPNNDWDTFYNYYLDINNCKYCNVKLTYGSATTRTQKSVQKDI